MLHCSTSSYHFSNWISPAKLKTLDPSLVALVHVFGDKDSCLAHRCKPLCTGEMKFVDTDCGAFK